MRACIEALNAIAGRCRVHAVELFAGSYCSACCRCMQVLQSLTQQLINERTEKGELQEMLQQEGHELEAAVAANQELQTQLEATQQQVGECWTACTSVPLPGLSAYTARALHACPACMVCPLPSAARSACLLHANQVSQSCRGCATQVEELEACNRSLQQGGNRLRSELGVVQAGAHAQEERLRKAYYELDVRSTAFNSLFLPSLASSRISSAKSPIRCVACEQRMRVWCQSAAAYALAYPVLSACCVTKAGIPSGCALGHACRLHTRRLAPCKPRQRPGTGRSRAPTPPAPPWRKSWRP